MSQRKRTRYPGVFQDEKTGEYGYVVREGVDPNTGKVRWRRRCGFERAADARDEREKMARSARKRRVAPKRVTVAELLETDAETQHRLGKWRGSTKDVYRRMLDQYVRGAIGRLRAQDLSAGHLDRLYGDMLADGQSPATVQLVHAMISGAYKRALKRGEVSANPCPLATPPSIQQAETASWTLDEARTFFSHPDVRAHPDVVLFRLLWATGMRRGEAVALLWEDVDLEAAVIVVRRNATAVGGEVLVGEPKTARSKRRVKIGPDTVRQLRVHRARQDEHRLAMGSGWREHGLVFPAVGGTLQNPTTVSSRFATLVAKAGVRRISLHGLRHAAATLMLERGLPVHSVASRLGHDPAVLLRRYSHAVVDSQDAAAQLETLLDGDQPALRVVAADDGQPDDFEAVENLADF